MSNNSQISQEVMNEFVAEAKEIIERVNQNLGLIEKKNFDNETINQTYRDMHTLKGTAQLFGFSSIGNLAHAMETTLDPLRKSDDFELTSEFIDALFVSIDLIETIVTALNGDFKPEEYEEKSKKVFGQLLDASVQNFGGKLDLVADKVFVNDKEEIRKVDVDEEAKNQDQAQKAIGSQSDEKENLKKKDTMKKIEKKNGEQVLTKEAPKQNTSSGDNTVRVHVDLLDKLMNLVGEIVLVRNQVLQYSDKNEDLDFLNLSQNLNIVTSDLQSEVMKTRMQPIGNILNKFQRVVRDISKDLSKEIELTLEGTETELDKTLIEAIKDPLTHIVRNSCDHGIEIPKDREDQGKSSIGQVKIRAFHEGGHVIIEVQDDGRGLDRDKIIAKAMDKDLITSEQAERMSDREAYLLIFRPGFSTAEQVSSVSGRGVGMDVVRTNIESIGGSVELTSQKGQGSKVSLKIPLTLAIVPALLVETSGERFAIPQVKLVELVRVDQSEEESGKIESLQGKPVFRLRGNLLQLIELSQVIGYPSKSDILSEQVSTNIIVLDADGEQFGLVVDEILDTADIVVKPLTPFLKPLGVYSGSTILGNGSVALILDVIGIAHKAGLMVDGKNQNEFEQIGRDEHAHKSDLSQDFLLIKTNALETYGIPLCLINRLEMFETESLKHSGEQEIIQYRNSILPLISLNQFLNYEEEELKSEQSNKVAVVVLSKQNRHFGLKVNKILDVIEISSEIDDSLKDRPGIFGNVVVNDEVIVVVDVLTILDKEIEKMNIQFKEEQQIVEKDNNVIKMRGRVLLAEDTPFFRRQIVKFLMKEGYEVDAEENGKLAFEKLTSEGPDKYTMILSDIEMPEMDGFEFAQKVRGEENYSHLPMIAITTRFRQRDIDKGREVGFTRYLEKLNQEKLLSAMDEVLVEMKGAS